MEMIKRRYIFPKGDTGLKYSVQLAKIYEDLNIPYKIKNGSMKMITNIYVATSSEEMDDILAKFPKRDDLDEHSSGCPKWFEERC